MADRLSPKQRRVIASLMEIFGSPTRVRREFAEQFPDGDPPSRLTIYRIYNRPEYKLSYRPFPEKCVSRHDKLCYYTLVFMC